MTATWKHDELLADLASHLAGADRMIWTDMQLGPSGSPRPDVYVLHKSYSKPRPLAFEIKVSKSDLRSDTTSGKWESYLKYASGVVFAVPDGLCTAADIPAQCGLIVRKAEVWRYVRKPTVQPVALGMDAVMKLLMDGVGRVYRGAPIQPRRASFWQEPAAVRKKFGEAVAIAARDIGAAQQSLSDIRTLCDTERAARQKKYDEIIAKAHAEAAEIDKVRGDLCELLDVPPTYPMYAIRTALDKLRAEVNADARVQQAEAKLSRARSTLENALHHLPAPAPTEIAA